MAEGYKGINNLNIYCSIPSMILPESTFVLHKCIKKPQYYPNNKLEAMRAEDAGAEAVDYMHIKYNAL